MFERDFVHLLVEAVEQFRQFGLLGHVVEAIAEEQRTFVLQIGHLGNGVFNLCTSIINHRLVSVEAAIRTGMAECSRRKVAIGLIDGGYPIATGRFPVEHGTEALLCLCIEAAHEQVGIESKAAQDLWHLRNVPEWIRDVADRHGATETLTEAPSFLQIADNRLSRHQKQIRQCVPRANEQPLLLNKPA